MISIAFGFNQRFFRNYSIGFSQNWIIILAKAYSVANPDAVAKENGN
ncbi:hypothetical protein [Flavobacterium franklandianum]|nr:hypothetical protein [Flavobacterium franklandianum]